MMSKPEMDRLIRESEVKAMVGLKTTRLKELIEAGQFPAPVAITAGGRARGYVLREVQGYIKDRIAERDEQAKQQPRPPKVIAPNKPKLKGVK